MKDAWKGRVRWLLFMKMVETSMILIQLDG
jgi:hypothetical protein